VSTAAGPIVYIVDDDESVRRALKRLLHSAGMEARTFESGEEFLDAELSERDACLIADVMMPGIGGVELQQELISRASELPVIFITAFDSEETRLQVKSAGGIGYFRKPVDGDALLDAVRWALSRCAGMGTDKEVV